MSVIAKMLRPLSVAGLILAIIGCAVLAEQQLNEQWGEPSVKQRLVSSPPGDSVPDYHQDIQPILDSRCVVCHACYDAPCQLKLSSFEGLDRGASKKLVYNGTRLLADEPSRLFVDAKSTLAWRQRDYFPVLNEREQNPEANKLGSSLYRMLKLKQKHPLPEQALLPDSFDLKLARDQQCATIEEFSQFEEDYPLWGMPYGLPQIDQGDFKTIEAWIEAGSPVTAQPPLDNELVVRIKHWEQFFNQADTKSQLVSRYLYEHLFLANLYFAGIDEDRFFKLVRSRTPTGEPIEEIATRRPYDHPGVDVFFYRLRPVHGSRVAKTHMPYALSGARMKRWKALFFEPEYTVLSLPSYSPKVASNPFKAFQALPAKSRYQFMLDEAQYTIMSYIKGPVCRGQVSLNVIEDHFWVMFVDPDVEQMLYESELRQDTLENLRLPAESESNALPTEVWTKYSELQAKHIEDRFSYLRERYPEGVEASLDVVWDGDGHNQNAALTVFRHFDAATVLKGFQGGQPKTAWLISYSLLERIHYLLVAGFDVYGNVGHQLNTRLYMDFLRMEGESNFLMLLPKDAALAEFEHWYRGAEEKVQDYMRLIAESGIRPSGIPYQSQQPKAELFSMIQAHLGTTVLPDKSVPIKHSFMDKHLHAQKGPHLQWMPELAYVRIRRENGERDYYSFVVNRGHTNVSSLLLEALNLVPEEDTLSVIPGIVGTYPNAFFDIQHNQLEAFSKQIRKLKSEADYFALKSRFGMRRSDSGFWQFADDLHDWYRQNAPLEYGLLDFNRLENR